MGKKPASTKAVAYIRASTGRQIISPQDQREKIEAYCKMAGLELVEVITEKGVSAGRRLAERPEGAKVEAALKQARHLVALKLDRVFRDAGDALECTKRWDAAGISLHLIDMGGQTINTATAMGRMFLTMMAGFAELEKNLIGERTSAALQFNKKQRRVYSRITPYGFNAVDGELVPNQGEGKILERMRALRSQKPQASYRSIADELNDDGVPAKLGGLWHPFSIMKILKEVTV
jgi:DNA invertase Pin-like site-specific DNA recombinase